MWHDVRHIAAMNQRQNGEMVEKRSVAHIAMAGAPFLAAIIPGVCLAQSATEDAVMTAYRDKTQVVRPCRRDPGSIVVCGSRAERNARERIPLPDERDTAQRGIVRNEAPRASAAKVREGACGITINAYTTCTGGWSGAKMLDGLVKGITAVADPDADLAAPPALPKQFEGATPP